MNVPGSDILALALSVLGTDSVQYYSFVSRAVNAIGYEEATYAEPVAVEGSVQALPRSEFEKLGLDLAKEYVYFFASLDMQNAGRDRANDYLGWDGSRWDIVNVTSWYAVDGWAQVLAVRIGPLS